MNSRQFQSDYQPSLKLMWRAVEQFPYPKARNFPEGNHSRSTLSTQVGILTSCSDKRGKPCRGNGPWLPREEGGMDQMASLSVLDHPGDSWNIGQDRRKDWRVGSWHWHSLDREKNAADSFCNQKHFHWCTDLTNVCSTFLPVVCLVCLLTFPKPEL